MKNKNDERVPDLMISIYDSSKQVYFEIYFHIFLMVQHNMVHILKDRMCISLLDIYMTFVLRQTSFRFPQKRRSEEKIIKIWRKMLNKKNFRQV